MQLLASRMSQARRLRVFAEVEKFRGAQMSLFRDALRLEKFLKIKNASSDYENEGRPWVFCELQTLSSPDENSLDQEPPLV